MPKASAIINMPIDREAFNELCVKCLNKVPNSTLTKDGEVFHLKEKMTLTTWGVQSEIKYEENTVTITSKIGGWGPIQGNRVKEANEVIKCRLEQGLNNPEDVDNPDVVRCPKCGSNQIEIYKKDRRICKNCMFKF